MKEHYAKRHKIYASISIVAPLSSALLELKICANWYPVVLYSSGNGPPKNASTRTDPNTRTGMSITGNGILRILVPIHTHTAHNTHKKVTHHQLGRTATFSCRELVCYIKQRCVDQQGLGRWCSTLFYLGPHHRLWLISAYNVGRQKPRGDSTIYQQQVCYIQTHGVDLSPSRLFNADFVVQLQVCQ